MQTFTTLLSLALAAISLAAPTMEKRADIPGSITVYANANYLGSSQEYSFVIPDGEVGICVAANLRSDLDSKVSSVRLGTENGQYSCQLRSEPECVGFGGKLFKVRQPDLSKVSDPALGNWDNKARSLFCFAE